MTKDKYIDHKLQPQTNKQTNKRTERRTPYYLRQ